MQRNNTVFRDLIIKRERQKALRVNMFLSQQKASLQQQSILQAQRQKENLQQLQFHKNLSQDAYLDVRATHFAHVRQQLIQTLNAWHKTKNPEITFIRREDRKGTYFQTFDKDAKKTARILGLETKKMKVNRKMIQYLSFPEKRMNTVFNELSKRDLSAKIINTKGQEVSLTRKRTTSPAITVSTPNIKPKINAVESLEQNRQDGRHTSIHIENLAVWADSRGNWKVSGMVNGLTVTAKSIDQDDAVNYKKGEITKEQLVEKYQLNQQPKQQNNMARKSTLARKYSLDDS